VEQSLTFRSHPPEDLLEEYAFGRLNEERCAPVEEHLLLCPECRQALTEIDQYASLMKSETARLMQSPFQKKIQWVWRAVWPTAGWPRAGWALAAAAGCLALVLYVGSRPAGPPVPVALVSVRGQEPSAHAPARRPLDLKISADDVKASNAYRVEIVDGSGKQIWSGEAKFFNGRIEVAVPGGLAKGSYWVRLYDQSQLLQEFGLRSE